MIIKELHIAVARTINTGNFENVRLEAGLTVSITESDDLDTVRAEMLEAIRKTLSDTWKANKPRRDELKTG